MTSKLRRFNSVGSKTLDSFSRRFDAFSKTLTVQELAILEAVVLAAMPPHDRIIAEDGNHLLDAEEESILRDIEERGCCLDSSSIGDLK